jgi:hypothetical protein
VALAVISTINARNIPTALDVIDKKAGNAK